MPSVTASVKPVKPTKSSGNVFEDLGFPKDEAAVMQLKTDLKIAIEKQVQSRRLTRKQLVQVLDAQPSQISDLLTGKLSSISIDKLTKYANRLGIAVQLKTSIKKSPHKKSAPAS